MTKAEHSGDPVGEPMRRIRAVRSAEGGVQVLEVPIRPDQGSRVAIATSGICGSDLHLVGSGPSPVTLGHEFCGRLDDGTPVTVVPVRPCGHCERCLGGEGQQCPELFASMYGITLDGGLAEEAWVDPVCTKVLPDGLALENACLVEPLAVAVHGLRRSGAAVGHRVVVIGDGPIGLCTVAVAAWSGIDVDLAAHRRHRREAGERLGAGTNLGHDYDLVVDAAGTQSSMDLAITLARPGGTIGLVGTFWDPVAIDLSMQMKEITLVPGFTYGHHEGRSEFEEAIGVLDGSPQLADTLITHRFALEDATEAFRVAADPTSGAIKVVVHGPS